MPSIFKSVTSVCNAMPIEASLSACLYMWPKDIACVKYSTCGHCHP